MFDSLVGESETICWSCRDHLAGLTTCASCGAVQADKPSLMSKSHPGRLDFRAALIVIMFPPVFLWKAFEAFGAGDTTTGLGFTAGLVVILGIAGGWLWSRYGS